MSISEQGSFVVASGLRSFVTVRCRYLSIGYLPFNEIDFSSAPSLFLFLPSTITSSRFCSVNKPMIVAVEQRFHNGTPFLGPCEKSIIAASRLGTLLLRSRDIVLLRCPMKNCSILLSAGGCNKRVKECLTIFGDVWVNYHIFQGV